MKLIFLLSLSCLISCIDHSQYIANNKPIELKDWQVSYPIPGQSVSVGYGIIRNNTKNPVTLMAIESDSADSIEIHQHKHQDGIMAMMELASLTIAAESEISFTTGSYHLMVFDADLSDHQTITLSFEFSNKTKMTVDAGLFYR